MSSITDYKVSASDIAKVSVTNQPDTLTGTATQNKQVFDNYPAMVAEHLNNALDYLDEGYTDNFSIDRETLVYFQNNFGLV